MALDLFGDWGFVGSENTTPDQYQDSQTCINWYVEATPSPPPVYQGLAASATSKTAVALLGRPGLIQLVSAPGGGAPGNQTTTWPVPSSVTNLPVRGAYNLPGFSTGLVVIGNTCYLVTAGVQGATQTPGTLTLKNVGTLLTNSGPVTIRDNNNGGMAIIVDGTNVYYYLLSGVQQTVTFTGGVSSGSPTITVASIPAALLVTPNATITDTSGYVPANTTLTAITGSTLKLTMSKNATNTNAADTITITIPVFGQITDPQLTSFTGASYVAYIDGWFIITQPNSQTFYTNQPIYSGTYNAIYFALKDGASDNLMAAVDNKELLWLIGERTTEIWYNAGGQYFPFQRLAGTMQQYGCKAVNSISRLKSGSEDSLIWLGRSERGENIVLKTKGYSTEVVSTPAISDAISTYTITSDAIGYSYEEDGHEFYVLTFPSADRTWVYDATVPAQFSWTQRLSYDPYANSFHRERPNCFMNIGGMRVVGDYQNGALYQMTRAAYTDAGWPIRCQRRSPFIWDKDNRQRVQMTSLQVEFSPGQGNAINMGSNPQARLRISRDYGTTYGEPIYSAIGAIGNYMNRCIWRKLGWTRGSVAEIEIIDPVKRDIVGATLRAMGS